MTNERRDGATASINQHASEEVCNDILLGLVARPDVERWAQHFTDCVPCERRFQKLAGEIEVVRSQPVPHLPISSIRPASRRRFPRRWRLVTALAAASFVFLLLGGWPRWFEGSADNDFWLPVEQQEIALRSNATPAAKDFAAAMRAYEQRDAAAAVRQLQAPLGEEGYDLLRQVYFASALALSGDPQAALDVLQALQPATLPQPWKNRSLWVRYGCLKALGREQAAQPILQKLTQESGRIGDLARQEQQRLR